MLSKSVQGLQDTWGAPPALIYQDVACRQQKLTESVQIVQGTLRQLARSSGGRPGAYATSISSKDSTLAPSILVPLRAAAAHEYAANSRTLSQAKGQPICSCKSFDMLVNFVPTALLVFVMSFNHLPSAVLSILHGMYLSAVAMKHLCY